MMEGCSGRERILHLLKEKQDRNLLAKLGGNRHQRGLQQGENCGPKIKGQDLSLCKRGKGLLAVVGSAYRPTLPAGTEWRGKTDQRGALNHTTQERIYRGVLVIYR